MQTVHLGRRCLTCRQGRGKRDREGEATSLHCPAGHHVRKGARSPCGIPRSPRRLIPAREGRSPGVFTPAPPVAGKALLARGTGRQRALNQGRCRNGGAGSLWAPQGEEGQALPMSLITNSLISSSLCSFLREMRTKRHMVPWNVVEQAHWAVTFRFQNLSSFALTDCYTLRARGGLSAIPRVRASPFWKINPWGLATASFLEQKSLHDTM